MQEEWEIGLLYSLADRHTQSNDRCYLSLRALLAGISLASGNGVIHSIYNLICIFLPSAIPLTFSCQVANFPCDCAIRNISL